MPGPVRVVRGALWFDPIDICADISVNTGQGKGLVVLIEQYGLFGAWTTSQRGSPAPPDETLEKLISNGAFEQLSLDTLASGSPAIRYKPQEKRALAVRLGYCLMDFFDSDLSSKRIYFLGAPSKSSGSETLYLSFDSGSSATDESHIFRVGHPALLSFAKLLLEIEFGKIIDLEVTRHYGATNRATWAALCEMVDMLEEERDDSYVQAIRGCLMVHSQISKALRLSGADSKSAELTIRKEIYRELVCKLEDGLVESIPRYQRKRQRSESPEPFTRRKSNARATRSSWDTALSNQARTLEHPPPGSPAHTSPGAWTKRVSVEAVNPIPIPRTRRPWIPLPKSTGLFDDYTPDNVLPDVAAHADSFINHHRSIYDNLIQITPDMPRIKVAVLDTGLDVGHPSIQANVEQIKDVKSWLPANSAAGSDPCGHGTHVIGLLLDVAPDCDVYVAQIADNKNPLSLHQIAKAVDHAVTVWQVDIISMSFGVLDEREDGCVELRAALLRAHAAKVLMFAAASNTGGVDPAPAFPARLSNVFCIYSVCLAAASLVVPLDQAQIGDILRDADCGGDGGSLALVRMPELAAR
ncbi:peptidase S8/S53 domain-containing protein [Chaetomium tenue]|uniref:Peptidase S8/S53 domain-containing protein n=1 Tax=Chaetomium tenue TaxID=1854479 RepID=A0ACB7NW60_9PEZI|nr:peptidase S8/S53 domain-containing protein [Chaetomium globosum]